MCYLYDIILVSQCKRFICLTALGLRVERRKISFQACGGEHRSGGSLIRIPIVAALIFYVDPQGVYESNVAAI
jgi:hypothetical protein